MKGPQAKVLSKGSRIKIPARDLVFSFVEIVDAKQVTAKQQVHRPFFFRMDQKRRRVRVSEQ